LVERIENDLQYRVTAREAEKFETALANADRDTEGLDPLLRQAIRDALQSLLDDLRVELAAYEARHGYAPATQDGESGA
jgi:hypothetical protein